MCRGMWVSQVEPCNHRFVTAGLYGIEWINGGLELLITSGRNNFLISSTRQSLQTSFISQYLSILNLLPKEERTESCRNIHLGFIYLLQMALILATFTLGKFLLFLCCLFDFSILNRLFQSSFTFTAKLSRLSRNFSFSMYNTPTMHIFHYQPSAPEWYLCYHQ